MKYNLIMLLIGFIGGIFFLNMFQGNGRYQVTTGGNQSFTYILDTRTGVMKMYSPIWGKSVRGTWEKGYTEFFNSDTKPNSNK